MASFNLGPHPKMMTILNANPDLRLSVPLTDFIEKLKLHETGTPWKELAPEGASMLTWYLLYAAYEEDEADNRAWRESQLQNYNEEEVGNAKRSQEIARGRIGKRIIDETGNFG